MADETELAPEEGQETITSPEEEQKPDPVADLASQMGWVPQDQFRGDPEDWKPAADFIKAGRDINRNLSRELRGMREQVERVGQATSHLIEERVAARDAYWKDIHTKAVEKGDTELAERAHDERVKLTQEKPQATSGDPPETTDFKARNASWFGVDDVATLRAMEVGESMRRLGKSIPEQLQAAERVIKKEFPELFKAPSKTPAQTQTAETRSASTTSRAKGFADMPAESQKMALDYEKRHGIKRDTFAQSYWADQQKRKVG